MPIAQWLGLATPGPGELSPKRLAEDGKDTFVADTSGASSRRQGVPLAPAERAVQQAEHAEGDDPALPVIQLAEAVP
jgi:hypothetical protein